MSKNRVQSGGPPGRSAGGRRALTLAAGLGILGTIGIASADGGGKQFTPDDVGAIVSTLREADSRIYLIRLPTFRDGRIVGSQMYGSLPMRDVELLAESLKIELQRDANVLAVFDPGDEGDDDGGAGGGGSSCDEGGGPGSHVSSQSGGEDLARRIEVLLQDIDTSSYQFLR
jgi:hypothetical protein